MHPHGHAAHHVIPRITSDTSSRSGDEYDEWPRRGHVSAAMRTARVVIPRITRDEFGLFGFGAVLLFVLGGCSTVRFS